MLYVKWSDKEYWSAEASEKYNVSKLYKIMKGIFEGGPSTLLQAYAILYLGTDDFVSFLSLITSLISFSLAIHDTRVSEVLVNGLKIKAPAKKTLVFLFFFSCFEITSFLIIASLFGVVVGKSLKFAMFGFMFVKWC